MFDEKGEAIVLFNHFGEILISKCVSVQRIHYIKERENCYKDLAVLVTVQDQNLSAFLTNDGILRRDSMITSCDSKRIIILPIPNMQVVKQGRKATLEKSSRSTRRLNLNKQDPEIISFNHSTLLLHNFDLIEEIAKLTRINENGVEFYVPRKEMPIAEHIEGERPVIDHLSEIARTTFRRFYITTAIIIMLAGKITLYPIIKLLVKIGWCCISKINTRQWRRHKRNSDSALHNFGNETELDTLPENLHELNLSSTINEETSRHVIPRQIRAAHFAFNATNIAPRARSEVNLRTSMGGNAITAKPIEQDISQSVCELNTAVTQLRKNVGKSESGIDH